MSSYNQSDFLKSPNQRGPLDIEIISEEFIVMLRQLSYAIKNQLKGLSCLSLVLYGIRISGSMH